MTTISVIIPTLNEQKYITDLLNDIKIQTLKPDEIIVVDGQSNDKTQEKVSQYKNAKLLVCPPNVASQRNFGAKMACSSILIFLDADTRLSKNFIEEVIKDFKKRKLDLACPLYIPFRSTIIINLIYHFFNLMFILFQKIAASGAGSCIIVKKSVFKSLRGFNQAIKFDDIEFIRRASQKYQYSIIFRKLYVSDRRFKKDGTLRIFLQYLLLSALFLINQFNLTPGFNYKLHGEAPIKN